MLICWLGFAQIGLVELVLLRLKLVVVAFIYLFLFRLAWGCAGLLRVVTICFGLLAFASSCLNLIWSTRVGASLFGFDLISLGSPKVA